ncbi:MAG TPA: glycoside hydrolase family 5 protein [Oligoflexus sp.]|uniref:glycoside hydrolase family 5 protein n=1 Tax=Oligoflexus sp. TaxID=1971216 RepID=UPI002D803566|nr:glycoside hydrolase family 5 protein [Oligoflexus sp.]HET9241723.1 glycoside hydrolase family 5 protein [Oligoflexus sp.]
MKTSRILPVLAFSSLLLTNCKMTRPELDRSNSSTLSDVKVVELDKGGWGSFDFKLERLRPSPETVQSSYQKVAGQTIVAKTKVLYGDYKLLLTYKDAQGKAIYESCPNDRAKEHNIRVPTYSVTVQVCSIGGSTPIGTVVGDGADVIVKPELAIPGGKTPETPTPNTPAPPVTSGSFVAQHGMLSVSGNKIVDKDKKPIQLKGMSLFWSHWSGNFWNSDAVTFIKKDWKATLIRAAMGVEDGGYLTQPNAEKDRVKTIVNAAMKEGIYVIIDWHDHHATRNTAKAVEFFSEMAGLYANNPHVIFEIYNEPLDDSWEQVKAYAETVTKAIRAKGAQNLVIVGSPSWSQRVDLAADNPVQDKNVAYTLHFYSGTHRQDLRDKATYALNKGIALFVTEFGVCDASGNGNIDLAEADRWMAFMDQHKLSWANWSLFDKNESASALKPGANPKGGWTTNDLTESGNYIRKKMME